MDRVIRQTEMVGMAKSGKTYAEIGKVYGVSRQRVHQIVNQSVAIKWDKIADSIPKTKNSTYYQAILRRKVNAKLGGKCVKCGFSDRRALQVDHVNGGGNKHRKTIHWYTFYKSILNDTVDVDVQLLCANCNFIKRYENKEHKNGK